MNVFVIDKFVGILTSCVLNLLTGRIQYSFVVLEGGIALWFFPNGQKKKKKSVKLIGFFPLGSLGHRESKILHCAGPHPLLGHILLYIF